MRTPILVYCWLILKTTSYEWRGLCYKQSNVPVHAKEGVAPAGYEKDNTYKFVVVARKQYVRLRSRYLMSDGLIAGWHPIPLGVACLGVCAAETRNG